MGISKNAPYQGEPFAKKQEVRGNAYPFRQESLP
jgi:hypothetical protein